MRIHKSGHEILSVEDWFSYTPPKKRELQWKDRRSAKELAQSWFKTGIAKPSEELVALLEGSSVQESSLKKRNQSASSNSMNSRANIETATSSSSAMWARNAWSLMLKPRRPSASAI
jgi:hypothetical protein